MVCGNCHSLRCVSVCVCVCTALCVPPLHMPCLFICHVSKTLFYSLFRQNRIVCCSVQRAAAWSVCCSVLFVTRLSESATLYCLCSAKQHRFVCLPQSWGFTCFFLPPPSWAVMFRCLFYFSPDRQRLRSECGYCGRRSALCIAHYEDGASCFSFFPPIHDYYDLLLAATHASFVPSRSLTSFRSAAFDRIYT